MNFQLTHPSWLWLLPLVWAWVVLWTLKSDIQIGKWRRWTAMSLRLAGVTLVVLAIAGLQWMRPLEGVNVFFLLDRSDSIPSYQQEAARSYVNQAYEDKKKDDRIGLLVFGADAALEWSANTIIETNSTAVLAVIGSERTDIAAAVRLGTAAFPETGQKRLVLLSDGNENQGDALASVLAARPLDVTIDVIPLGVQRSNDLSLQKLGLPARVKKGQTFETKIFVQTDRAQTATVRLYRNDQPLGEQQIDLTPGKNLFTFPQTLEEPGFYTYGAFVEAQGDSLPQNNRASGFVHVRGEPRVLLVSSDLSGDQPLLAALRSANLEVAATGLSSFPASLAEMQSYDSIFISNLAAGDLGLDAMKLLESAVRDFGVGLVCVGGDQTYAAGSYRGTPLETTLPVNMELDSKKVLPSGAVVLVMHGMEFMDGNQVARDCALGVLDALGPQDELGVVLWDGNERWLFPLQKVGDKKKVGREIAGMNQGDLPSFQNVMSMAHQALQKSSANLKHMLVFSDGDPGAPTQELMDQMVADKITVSTVLIAGHFGPQTMQWIAANGNGRFYDINNPSQLPQIFIKEAAVILKSAIFEEPFQPRLVATTELVRGIGASEYPTLRGYVCTTPKARAETPLISDKGDPVLAHWQYGLGRAVAFTSDAKAKWAQEWLGWEKYRQFWVQTAQWSLRRIENADFTADVSVERGEGVITVEALDEKGDYRNFLNLQAVVVSPNGERQTVRLEQAGPGRYEARFPTREIGAYMLNVVELQNGQVRGQMAVGASVNYSPEFNASEPNMALLKRLVDTGGGKFLNPDNSQDNPFLHDRRKTFQARDLWEWLLKFAVILFPLDVGIRRIQLDREEWLKATATLRRLIFFWRGKPRPLEADESLAALLARRDMVRSRHVSQPSPPLEARPELFRPAAPVKASPPEAGPTVKPESAAKEESTPAKQPEQPASTTGRLLEAKRRAQRKK